VRSPSWVEMLPPLRNNDRVRVVGDSYTVQKRRSGKRSVSTSCGRGGRGVMRHTPANLCPLGCDVVSRFRRLTDDFLSHEECSNASRWPPMLIKHVVGGVECDQFQTKKRMMALSRTPGHQTRNIGRYIRHYRKLRLPSSRDPSGAETSVNAGRPLVGSEHYAWDRVRVTIRPLSLGQASSHRSGMVG
jgi:hypothetical protein